MRRRVIRILCHDCRRVLVADERLHYGYQCHACVVTEHELILLAARDPDHPEAGRLRAGAVDLGPADIDSGTLRA